MNLHSLSLCGAAACLLLALAPAPLGAQEGEPPAAQDPLAELKKTWGEHGLQVDLERGTIAVPCLVARPEQALEFLLIHKRGKDHEAMFVCTVPGSVLNSAFLALGYQNGKNAEVIEKDPLPTQEEVAKGAAWFDVIQPQGMPVWFTVRWTKVNDDGEKVKVELPVEDVLIDDLHGGPVENAEWIYLGGQMAPIYRGEPPVFVADYEGNLVSNVYKPQPNHLVTLKHEHANDDQIWFPGDNLPIWDTPVTLVIHKQKTELHKAREERLKKANAAQAKKDGEAAATGKDPGKAPEKEPGKDGTPRD